MFLLVLFRDCYPPWKKKEIIKWFQLLSCEAAAVNSEIQSAADAKKQQTCEMAARSLPADTWRATQYLHAALSAGADAELTLFPVSFSFFLFFHAGARRLSVHTVGLRARPGVRGGDKSYWWPDPSAWVIRLPKLCQGERKCRVGSFTRQNSVQNRVHLLPEVTRAVRKLVLNGTCIKR